MWKPNQPGNNTPTSPEPARPVTPTGTTFEATTSRPPVSGSAASSAVPTGEQATIGKSLIVKGELSGSESLYIDGKVEGAINLPGNRVTVGRNGQVAANIVAREVVVLGKVRGNCQASDRVDIRSEGSLIWRRDRGADLGIEDINLQSAYRHSCKPGFGLRRLPPRHSCECCRSRSRLRRKI